MANFIRPNIFSFTAATPTLPLSCLFSTSSVLGKSRKRTPASPIIYENAETIRLGLDPHAFLPIKKPSKIKVFSANPKELYAKILKSTGISVAQAVELNTNKKYEPTLTELIASDETLSSPDYFQVYNLFTVRDLWRARVHLGHKMGTLDSRMAPFLFGSRFDMAIIDLDKTAFHLRQALNFLAHVAYRKGIILWVGRSPQSIHLIESSAIECGEYSHTREWDIHTLTNSTRKYGGITRLPDTILFLSTLDTVMRIHLGVTDGAKMLIPTVGVVDSNCNPNLITYPIPGNDDSLPALQLYCSLFKEAILRGKNKRKQVDALNQQRKLERQQQQQQQQQKII